MCKKQSVEDSRALAFCEPNQHAGVASLQFASDPLEAKLEKYPVNQSGPPTLVKDTHLDCGLITWFEETCYTLSQRAQREKN